MERAQVATPHSVSYEAAAVPVEARPALLDHQVWDFVASISELKLTITREALGLLLCWEGADEQSIIWPRLLCWQVTV